MTPNPATVPTANGQVLVLAVGNKDELTMRVQDSKAHNRAVAKLTVAQTRELWNVVGAWLAR